MALIKFVKVGLHNKFIGERIMSPDNYAAIKNIREDLKVFSNGKEISLDQAVGGDTFNYSVSHWKWDPEKQESEMFSTDTDGFFVENEPFIAEIRILGHYRKGVFLAFDETSKDRYHLIYPSQLEPILLSAKLDNGVFRGVFKYILIGNGYSLKFLNEAF